MKWAENHSQYKTVCDKIDSIKTPDDFYRVMAELRHYDLDVVNCVRESKECYNAAQYA